MRSADDPFPYSDLPQWARPHVIPVSYPANLDFRPRWKVGGLVEYLDFDHITTKLRSS